MKGKKGFVGNLSGLALAIVTLCVVVGVGIVILSTMGNNIASTSTAANTSISYGATQLGSGSGGLLSWLPVIIVVIIGFALLSMFGGKKSY